MRGFLCYAHTDRPLVDRLLALLRPRLKILKDLDLQIWSDRDLLIGQRWDDEIRTAIEKADFGLVLVSPALLASDYIRRVELPGLGDRVLPVGLQRVDFARSDLQGLDERQVFLFGPEGKWFADLGGENRARFCDELAGQIVDRLT